MYRITWNFEQYRCIGKNMENKWFAKCFPAECSGPSRRRGGAVLELILALPILVIGLMAIVEFGLLRANQQQLEYASRIGARVAADASNPTAPATVAAVSDAVKQHLQQANISTAPGDYRITLEYFDGSSTAVNVDGTLNCAAPANFNTPNGDYVRVIVCLDIVESGMTPNLLKTFGFNLSNKQMQQATTLRHEA